MLKIRVRENDIERKFIMSLSLNANKGVLQYRAGYTWTYHRSRGRVSSPRRGRCVVFSGTKLYSHIASPPRSVNGSLRTVKES